jgi:hypothetical protein
MAKYFLLIKVFSRSKGSRVTKAAAYRAGERIRDERTSDVFNHSDRQDVVHKEIVLPSLFAGRTDLSWARDRATLWNAAEHAGKRRDAALAREVLVLLPSELTAAQRTGLALKFSRTLAERYHNAVDLAVHLPRPYSDERFHHAHLLMTAREVTPAGLGPRITLHLSASERRARGLGPCRDEYFWIRERWAELANEALRDAGLTARIDHRSYKDQGVDREPVLVMPRSVRYAEQVTRTTHPLGDRIRAEYRERIEARLKGPAALQRVLQQQRNAKRDRAVRAAQRSAALPKKARRATLSREELNELRRERYRTHAPEINRKRREWRQANAEEFNRKRREKARAARAAAKGPAGIVAPDAAPSPTAAESARRWQELRALGQDSPTAEDSARQWLKSRESADASPTADDSVKRWLKLRERARDAAPPEHASDTDSGQHKPPRGRDGGQGR